MRLSFKIMNGVMIVVAVLLAIHSYLVVVREINQFRDDMDLHAYLLGTVLASSVADVWISVGPARAKSIVADANRSERLVRVRLVWLDQKPPSPDAPLIDAQELAKLDSGREILLPEYSIDNKDYHLAYFPVAVGGSRRCALELSQPLARVYRYTRVTVLQKVALFVVFLIVGGCLVWWMGIKLVGRPVKELVGQAQAVGKGNLYTTDQLEQSRDEIGALAKGFNQMVVDLRAARARLEQETSHRIAAVEQLNHAERLSTVGKLASGLAHELGTPLNVVSGRARMIADEGMSQTEVKESASVIRQQAERMTSLIRNLLNFAKSSSPEMQLENIGHPVEQVAHLLSPLASERGVTLTVEVDSTARMVRIESAQMQQVLSNLVMNAVHAMPDGGTVTIRCGVRRAQPPIDHGGTEGIYAFIEVIDHGVGIGAEDLSRVFVPFFSTKPVGEGTGLGLSIAHGLVKGHGGWITVESAVGKGSTFSIYLPLEGED